MIDPLQVQVFVKVDLGDGCDVRIVSASMFVRLGVTREATRETGGSRQVLLQYLAS